MRKRHYAFLALILLLLILTFGLDNRLTVTDYALASDKIASPVKLVLLADLHSCLYGENQSELIAAIDAQSPDLVVLSGDIADDVLPRDGTRLLLAGIAKYDCYYVTGNHEIWSGEADAIRGMFRAYGVTVLTGDCRAVEIRGQRLNICGVDDPAVGEAAFAAQLKSAAAGAEPRAFTLLLAHRPERIGQYAEYGFDLVLSGHAHGGQWRLPGLINGVFAPNQGFFPAYTSGFYEQNGVKMLVSRGLSRESTRIPRFFNPPEAVVLELGK